jgi:hypothetical protein
MISRYSFGSITIDRKEYSHDVIISAAKVKSWWRDTSHEVNIKDLDPILEEHPQAIIFGTGAAGMMRVLSETLDYLTKRGIKSVVLKTADAVKEYNRRVSENGVVAALHLTC